MMKSLARLVFVPIILILVFEVSSVAAQEQVPDGSVFQFSIVDELDQPIAGVSVKTTALVLDNNIAVGWESKPQRTDSGGLVMLKYIDKMSFGDDESKTKRIVVEFQKPGLSTETRGINIIEQKAKIVLKEESRIELSAIDDDRQAVKEMGVLSSKRCTLRWIDGDGESLLLAGLVPGRQQALFVKPVNGGKHLFSMPMSFNVTPGKSTKIRNLQLRPGVEVNGVFSENIPRPIVDGRVVVCCKPKPIQGSSEGEELRWFETANVNQQGEFSFPSLPSTGEMQVIAFCRGGVIKSENVFRGRVTGTIVDLAQVASEHTSDSKLQIQMEPTREVTLQFVDTDGGPLAGVDVRLSQNQYWIDLMTQTLGATNSSVGSLCTNFIAEPKDTQAKNVIGYRLRSKANAKGEATFQNVPPYGTLFLRLSDPGRSLSTTISVKGVDETGRLKVVVGVGE
ncbi:hypothetical protein [Planctomycetes bacterium K23_9]|uniref:Nickel uptake substrate-specific transmembrane region n=1 Tax=Stieleria marina TaxID=1930275 RepID=A0A517NWY1_9BACT|nr:hypothetical protein K239x_36420 [Planctomycetes bacterium K23_9]